MQRISQPNHCVPGGVLCCDAVVCGVCGFNAIGKVGIVGTAVLIDRRLLSLFQIARSDSQETRFSSDLSCRHLCCGSTIMGLTACQLPCFAGTCWSPQK
jgi:hypothetical protein